MDESVASIRGSQARVRFPEVTKLHYVTVAREKYNELFAETAA